MKNQYFIAGDWGSSNLRLYLCQCCDDTQTRLLETQLGPGIREAQDSYEELFFSLTQNWIEQYGQMPVILSGMIGSNLGWKETSYLCCPVDAKQIANGRVRFKARGTEFSILAGVRSTNPLDSPDLMRGEELQVLGWMQDKQNSNTGKRLLALPGTHNKWCYVVDNKIETFLTAFTGELFALLRKNSILLQEDSAMNINENAFIEGVKAIKNLGDAHLIHALFATRSKQIIGEMENTDSTSYLSGLIIGSDIVGALNLFKAKQSDLPITVVGEQFLSQLYLRALQYLGVDAEESNSTEIAIFGYAAIYQELYRS